MKKVKSYKQKKNIKRRRKGENYVSRKSMPKKNVSAKNATQISKSANKKKNSAVIDTKTIVLVGVLAALSYVLMLFPKIPGIIAAAPWLDIDFSDAPALLAAVGVSPVAGVLVVGIKNILHLTVTSTGGVGELSNFICGAALVFTCGLATKGLMKKTLNRIKLLVTLPIACIAQVIAAILGNYYLMIPLYGIQATAKSYILGAVIPFNIIKDIFVCVVFYLVYVLVYPKIQKRLY